MHTLIRGVRKSLTKRRRMLIAILSTFGLIAAAVFGVATSATASSYDRFGGTYYSSDRHASATNTSSLYTIQWFPNKTIEIQANVNDLAADSKGATLAIMVYPTDWLGRFIGGGSYYELRNTTGVGSYPYRVINIPWPRGGDSAQLTVQVCNGKSSAYVYGNTNCGAIHGPFNP